MTSESVVPWIFFHAAGLSSWRRATHAKSERDNNQDASRETEQKEREKSNGTNLDG